MPFDFSPSDVARFFTFVEKLPNGCWFWAGARSRGKGNKKWGGSFRVGGKVVRAHRFACEAVANPPKLLKRGEHRDHTCCFSLCVNPAHLEIVTHEENETRKKERKLAANIYAKMPEGGFGIVENGVVFRLPVEVPRYFEFNLSPSKERCHADRDGDCNHPNCPQLRDGEPNKTGRHCPIDTWSELDD